MSESRLYLVWGTWPGRKLVRLVLAGDPDEAIIAAGLEDAWGIAVHALDGSADVMSAPG